MEKPIRPQLSHMGVFVRDLDKMVDFYTRVLGLIVTDRGHGSRVKSEIVFMSADPEVHHQFILTTGRPADADFSVVVQASFTLASLDELRVLHRRLLDEGITEIEPMDHGIAWSLYARDPEGNMLELYVDSPWMVSQPHAHDFDITQPSELIVATTHDRIQSDPSFKLREQYVAEMTERLNSTTH